MTTTVAVIGAGPSGLVAARWLSRQAFVPTLFEQGPMLGGQWAGQDGRSGVWPRMHTNSSRTVTAFSDLEHDSQHVYLSNREVLDYLHRYAGMFGLTSRIRLGTRVDLIRRDEAGWVVVHAGTEERFERVVVATGRFHSPAIPAVAGLETFSGSAGAISTYRYRDGSVYQGKRVLVAGCAISALEIASEVAELGAARVVVTQRRQRYIAPKFVGGVPADHRLYTRYGALATEALAPTDVDRMLKDIVVGAAGSPDQYGAPIPDPSLFAAGVTLSQHYLPLVAEGRITVRPWIKSVMGPTVTFTDDHAEEFDGIVFGTGYHLCLPFLSEDIRAILDLDAVHMDADRYTFHPDLPGLAFMGLWDQSGGYFVPLELQARWIAYTWGGRIPAISESGQRSAIDVYRANRGNPQKTRMDLAALTFARAAGVEPDLGNWPRLRRALLFGPLAPSCFRLEGPDALPDAAQRFARDAARFGAITSHQMNEGEESQWSRVQAVLTDSAPRLSLPESPPL